MSFVPKKDIHIRTPKLPDAGMHFCFGDIVVVEGSLIGVVVKSWTGRMGANPTGPNHDVYVREFNAIVNYREDEMQRYMVRHKYLDDQELEYQHNAIAGV